MHRQCRWTRVSEFSVKLPNLPESWRGRVRRW